MELTSFTGITDNGDGSGTLTGVTRGLAFYGATGTTRSGNAYAHQAGSSAQMTNVQYYYDQLMDLDSDETVTGLKTFTQNPLKSTTTLASDAHQFIIKADLNNAVFGTTITNQVIVSQTLGTTLSAGAPVYKKVSDGKWYAALANDTTTFQQLELGILQTSGVLNDTVNVLLRGLDSNQTGLTAGTQYFLTDAGGISATPGTNNVFLGYGQSTTAIIFDPRSPYDIPYHGEKLALAGDNTDIAVGSGNKLVTQTGLQKNAELYGATATGNDTYVVTLSPAPTTYDNGRHYFVKLDVGNTGAATINFNGLGPISIVTGVSTALVTGDMLATGIYELIYNSTGPVFQLVNPSSVLLTSAVFSSGTTTYDTSTTSGNQSIAHGLGKTPKYVRVTAKNITSAGGAVVQWVESVAVYNGTTQSSQSVWLNGNPNTTVDNTFTLNSLLGGGTNVVGTITVTSSNIVIAWVKTGSPTGTYQLLWEAQA